MGKIVGEVNFRPLNLSRYLITGLKWFNNQYFSQWGDRDGILQSGMERGVDDSFQRLDELLEDGRYDLINYEDN
ncbi:MAG: hypothetical protein ACP5OJ_09145 [Methanothermobacter sp.]